MVSPYRGYEQVGSLGYLNVSWSKRLKLQATQNYFKAAFQIELKSDMGTWHEKHFEVKIDWLYHLVIFEQSWTLLVLSCGIVFLEDF